MKPGLYLPMVQCDFSIAIETLSYNSIFNSEFLFLLLFRNSLQTLNSVMILQNSCAKLASSQFGLQLQRCWWISIEILSLNVQPLTSITNDQRTSFVLLIKIWFFPCSPQITNKLIWYVWKVPKWEMFWSVFVFFLSLFSGGPKPSARHHASSLHDLLNSLPAEHHLMFETKAEI